MKPPTAPPIADAERQRLIEEINHMIEEAEADIAAGRTYSPEEARRILAEHRAQLAKRVKKHK